MTIRELQDARIAQIAEYMGSTYIESIPVITNYDTGLRITVADLRANEYPEHRDILEFYVLDDEEDE